MTHKGSGQESKKGGSKFEIFEGEFGWLALPLFPIVVMKEVIESVFEK